jgi:hypothetical protein
MKDAHCLWLLINGASGSHDEERLHALVAALEAAGAPAGRIIDCQQEGIPTRDMLRQAGVTVLAAHGGDGTLNAALTALEGWDGRVLPLPGGTANLLCRRLYGDVDLEEIVGLFGQGRLAACRPDCIRSSAGTGLAEILAGPGAIWADVREEMREGNIVETLATAVDAASRSATGPMVAIRQPMLGKEHGYAGVRVSIAAEGMMVQGYGAEDAGDYVKQGVALLRRDFREGPHDDLGIHASITCHCLEDEPIALMIDGERQIGRRIEQFSLAQLKLDLLCRRDG